MNIEKLKNTWSFWGALFAIAGVISLAAITWVNKTEGDEAFNEAKSAYTSGNLTAAQKQYEELTLGTEKSNPEAWNNLGNIYRDKKSYEQAATAYKKAISLDLKYDQAYRNISYVYIDWAAASPEKAEGLLKEGIDLLESGFAKNRKSISIAEDLVNLYLKAGNRTKADEYFTIREQLLSE